MWASRLHCAIATAVQSRLGKVSAESIRWPATAPRALFALIAEVTEQFAKPPRQSSSVKPGRPHDPQPVGYYLRNLPRWLPSSAYGSPSLKLFSNWVEGESGLVGGSHSIREHLSKATANAQRLGMNMGVHIGIGISIGGVTLLQTRSVHSSGSAGKKCPECQRFKDLVDFGKIHSGDVRGACRACAAASQAKRKGAVLHHLGLSVEQAWANARKCSRCGETKEVRDFAIMYRSTGKLQPHCRACNFAWDEKKRSSKPPGTLLECRHCHEIKPASEFTRGHVTTCKVCTNKRSAERYQMKRAAQLSIPEKKRCTVCGEEKRAFEFRLSKRSNGRLQSWCRECGHTLRALIMRRHAQIKQQPAVSRRKTSEPSTTVDNFQPLLGRNRAA